jgi:hypothetical protein
MHFVLRAVALLAASGLTLWPSAVAARPSPDAVKRDLDLLEERFINARSYKHDNSTVKLVGCKKISVPHSGVDAFERGWYTNLDRYQALGRHFYDASRHELRIYFPVEKALVEHGGKLLEANELGEFELDALDGDYAVVGRYQTDDIRGVDANIIRDGVIYLAEKVRPYRRVGNVFVYDFGYKDLEGHDHDHGHGHGSEKRCDALECPNQGCVKNHGGVNCSKKFGINHGRCTFRSDVCMDFNGWLTDCVRHTDAVGRILRFPGSDCEESMANGHCYNEAASFAVSVGKKVGN